MIIGSKNSSAPIGSNPPPPRAPQGQSHQRRSRKPTMHLHCESFPVQRAFFQVGKFINLRIGPARHRID
jgi:hypothetical protein